MVLLGGSIRPNPFGETLRRSLLDLPLDRGSILESWMGQAREVAQLANVERLPVRLMIDGRAIRPWTAAADRDSGALQIQDDFAAFRGTGGILRDLAHDYPENGLLLVANAAQILLEPLTALVAAMKNAGGDVGLVTHADGTPSGVMLLPTAALALIPPSGFVDLKEQGMPLIAAQFDVRVVRRERPAGLPVRSAADYLAAPREYHGRRHTTCDDAIAIAPGREGLDGHVRAGRAGSTRRRLGPST